MLSLPVELQEQVFDYLSRQDLLSLAQTCKINSFIANARLRAIIPELDPHTFTRCIRILAANPVRAAEILELNIAKYQFTPEPLGPSPPPPQRSALIATLKATIRKSSSSPTMPIEQTTLPCDPPRHPPLGPLDFSRAFTNLTRLRKLVIHAPQTPLVWMSPVVVVTLREIYVHDGAESTPLLGWISYQPRINTLRIHCSGNKLREYRVSPPNSIFFPFLSLLTTNPEGASILLPESAVEDLCIEDLEYAKELRRAEDGVVPSQRPSVITAIRDSRERLRRLTLAGETDGIFKLLKTLAEGGVLLSHIRIVLCSERTESIKSLVRVKSRRFILDSHPLLQEVELSCRKCNAAVIRPRNTRNI